VLHHLLRTLLLGSTALRQEEVRCISTGTSLGKEGTGASLARVVKDSIRVTYDGAIHPEVAKGMIGEIDLLKVGEVNAEEIVTVVRDGIMATERVWEVREVKAGAVRVAGVTVVRDGAVRSKHVVADGIETEQPTGTEAVADMGGGQSRVHPAVEIVTTVEIGMVRGDGAKITVPLSSNRGDGVPSLQRLQSHQHQVGGVKQRAMEAVSKIMIRTTQ